MSIAGIILEHGQASGVSILGSRVDHLVTGEHSEGCSIFELSIVPGFDTGAHYHTKMEEFFYVLEGELNLVSGDRAVRGGPGTFAFVPRGAVHSYGNPGKVAARMLLVCSPPGFEKYFDDLAQLAAKGEQPDTETISRLRAKYDTIQLSPRISGEQSQGYDQ
jgi:quercetin dioxygenase-like cupin family protein